MPVGLSAQVRVAGDKLLRLALIIGHLDRAKSRLAWLRQMLQLCCAVRTWTVRY